MTADLRRRLGPTWMRAAWGTRDVLDLYVFPVSGGPGPAADPARSLVDATAEVLRDLRQRYPEELTDRKYGILVDRLGHPVDRSLVIVDEHGEPCGYCHITAQDTVNERIRYAVRVAPHQAYLWDDHVFGAHRRRGLHAYSIARRLELLAQEGRSEALTIISRRNTASRTSYAAFGTTRTRALYYVPGARRTLTVPVRGPR